MERARLEQADATYARLLAQYAKTPFETADAERRLAALVRDGGIVELMTGSHRLLFVRRALSDRGVSYRVFRTELSAIIGEEPIGECEISKIGSGIFGLHKAEVSKALQREGIATAVYELLTSDMSKVGGLLWPVAPGKMSDAEFKIWWRRSPALVFYYPHRDRLGLRPRTEFEELCDLSAGRGTWERLRATLSAFLSRIRLMVSNDHSGRESG